MELFDQRLDLADEILQATGAQLVQISNGRRQHHRAGDRRRCLGLDVDVHHILLGEHLVAGLELALGEDFVLLERGDRRFLDQPGQRVRRRAQVRQAALLGLLVPGLGVAVAVEDDLLVGRPHVLGDARHGLLERGARAFQGDLQLVGEIVDRFGDDRVEHGVGPGRRGIRAERAELELVAGEGERARAVAIAAVERQRGQHGGAESKERAGLGGLHLAGLDRREDLLQLNAKKDRDDRRRRLVGAEAVVLPG